MQRSSTDTLEETHSSRSHEAQRLVSPSQTQSYHKTRRDKLVFGLAVAGCLCALGWLVVAIAGWVTAVAARHSISQSKPLPAAIAFESPNASFAIVALGVGGGPYEDDVSSYLICALHEDNPKPWVGLDGGAALGGLRVAVSNGVFANVQIPPSYKWMSLDRYIIQQLNAHHLIGHTHLDHVLGIVISTAETTFQNSNHTLWGLDFVVSGLSSSTFNNILWPALNTFPGSGLALGLLQPQIPFILDGSGLEVTPFHLAHGDLNSTAFLLKTSNNTELLYLSDLMPDACHWNARNHTCDVASINRALWTVMASHVISGALKAIMIEASYPSSRPDDQLFGHLTPCYVVQELRVLASRACANTTSCLKGMTVFITHVKAWWPSASAAEGGETPRAVMQRELKNLNTLYGTPGQGSNTSGCASQVNDLGADFVFVNRGFQYNV